MQNPTAPRIGVLVVAYNAAGTLSATLDRIPRDFLGRIDRVIISDDSSADNTFAHGRDWAAQAETPRSSVIRHTKNLGYGGNQKSGYELAIELGLDIIVLLHGDGQYAPEVMAELVAPIERGEADAVFGSRMMERGAARKGGMPLYKWVGNQVLTGVENRMLNADLTEFHSGYRAYSVAALKEIPFAHNSNGFDFDTQIIVQLLDAGKRIVEIPIPTYYGDEICYVDGLRYAREVVKDVASYRLNKVGFGTSEWVPRPAAYDFKEGDGSSHALILDMLADQSSLKILDLGCSGGLLAQRLRDTGHHVTGVDYLEIPGVRDRTDNFLTADLNDGIPAEAGADFDVVIAADVFEHLVDPRTVMAGLLERMKPSGQLLVSVPNVGHWYPRTRIAAGAFGYDRRGILDETHLRFFTRRGILTMAQRAGFDVVSYQATGLPLGVIAEGDGFAQRLVKRVDRRLVKARPTLFGYQHVVRLVPQVQDRVQIDF